jgi:hypothetical protein
MQAANAAFDKDAVEKELEEKLEEVRMLWLDVAKSQHLEVNPRGLSDHCGVCFLQVTVADEDVYNPKSSFFDNISCEAKGRGPRRTRYVAHLHLRLTRHHSFGLLGVSETAPTRLCVCVCVCPRVSSRACRAWTVEREFEASIVLGEREVLRLSN